MTAFHVAERNLLDEVEEAIEKIAPVIKTAKHFHRLKHSVKDLGAITDSLIAPRVFDIATGRLIETREFGKAYRFPRYEYDITIQYPAAETWGRAAQSDIALIRYKMLNTPTEVSGVQGRWFKPDVQIEMVLDDTNDFQYFVMPLYVEYSTDDTA